MCFNMQWTAPGSTCGNTHSIPALQSDKHVIGAETQVNVVALKSWSVPLMCQNELVDGFVQLMCAVGGAQEETDRRPTRRAHWPLSRSFRARRSACGVFAQCAISCRKPTSDRWKSPMVLWEDFLMIEVSIPSMEKEVDESGKTKKVRTRQFSLIGFLLFTQIRQDESTTSLCLYTSTFFFFAWWLVKLCLPGTPGESSYLQEEWQWVQLGVFFHSRGEGMTQFCFKEQIKRG